MKLSDLELLPSPLPDAIVFSLLALVRAIFYTTLTANIHETDATLEQMQGTNDAGLKFVIDIILNLTLNWSDASLERLWQFYPVAFVVVSSEMPQPLCTGSSDDIQMPSCR